MGVLVNTINVANVGPQQCALANPIEKLTLATKNNFNLGSNSCPLITELKNVNQGIAQGDFAKASLNAGFLSMAFASGAGASTKMNTASAGAMFTQAAAFSAGSQSVMNTSNTQSTNGGASQSAQQDTQDDSSSNQALQNNNGGVGGVGAGCNGRNPAEDADFVKRVQKLGRHFPPVPFQLKQRPIRVAVTGAAGQIGTFLCHFISQGRMFGPYQKVILQLIELPQAENMLKGLQMELGDSAYRCIHEIIPSTDPMEGFKDADVAILVGARPRGPGMVRADLLKANAKIFEVQGAAIDKVANKNIKVCVVGNPANTNALIASTFAPSIPKKNFTAMTRLDQMRATGQIAEKTGAYLEDIENVIIWGNHSATQYPDTHHATVRGQPLRKIVNDDAFLNGPFITRVAKRGAEIISVMKKSSAASAAAAACEHMHDWWYGNQMGGYASMGVITEEEHYGISTGICYSYPCQIENGEWKIVDGLEINEFSKEKMIKNQDELLEERKMALGK